MRWLILFIGFVGLAHAQPNDCLQQQDISRWNVIDTNHVLLWAPADQPHLVVVERECKNLLKASTLAFKARQSKVCGNNGSSIMHNGGICAIVLVEPVSEFQAEKILKRAATKTRHRR